MDGKMNLSWEDLKLFLTIAEEKSFSSAARKLNLGQPTLSRRISELETQIGDILFLRTNSGIILTKVGENLLPSGQLMHQWANEAERSLNKAKELPVGKVRITAPPGVAHDFIAPLYNTIQKKYPKIHFEVLSSIEILNLTRGQADLALRTIKPTEPELICIDEIHVSIHAFVSKSYFKKLPEKYTFSDIAWISWAPPYDNIFSHRELSKTIPNFQPVFTSDDFNVQLEACKQGAGAMILAKANHRFSKINDLIELDLNLGPSAKGSLYLVCHKKMIDLPKIKAVIEIIQNEFKYIRANR
jgi:DNA-binding transcriptional LysR family regulator